MYVLGMHGGTHSCISSHHKGPVCPPRVVCISIQIYCVALSVVAATMASAEGWRVNMTGAVVWALSCCVDRRRSQSRQAKEMHADAEPPQPSSPKSLPSREIQFWSIGRRNAHTRNEKVKLLVNGRGQQRHSRSRVFATPPHPLFVASVVKYRVPYTKSYARACTDSPGAKFRSILCSPVARGTLLGIDVGWRNILFCAVEKNMTPGFSSLPAPAFVDGLDDCDSCDSVITSCEPCFDVARRSTSVETLPF